MDIKNLATSVNASRNNDINKVPDKPAGVRQGNNDTAEATDRVTLTNSSAQVRDLESKAQSVNVDNSARIAELKAAIADGSYQVDAGKIADKLIQTEVLLAKVN